MSDRILSHKGYLGSIEISLEDNCLFGKLLHVRDLVTYEGGSPEELKKAFEESVDNYLDECKRLNVEPDRTFSGTFNVRIEPDLHRQVCIVATRRGSSLNEFVCNALEVAVHEGTTVINETHVHTHVHHVEAQASQQTREYAVAPSWQHVNEKRNKPRH